MINTQALLLNQVYDKKTHITHFVVNGVLFATYMPQISLNISISVDLSTEHLKVSDEISILSEHNSVVVVYKKPIVPPVDILTWHMDPEAVFWVIGAMNGLVFCGDFMPSIGWQTPQVNQGYSSNSMFDKEQAGMVELSRNLLLKMTNQNWNRDFISKQLAINSDQYITQFLANL